MMQTKQGRTLRLVRSVIAAGGFFLVGVTGVSAESGFSFQVTAYKQAVAESLGENEAVAAFYRARAFEPLWTGAGVEDRERRIAFFEALQLADDHALPIDRYDPEGLMARMAAVSNGRERGLLEMELTKTYLQFANDLQSGLLQPGRIDGDIKRVLPRRDPADLLAQIMQGDPRAAMRKLIPNSPEYTRLMRAKMMLEHRIAHGGWGPTVPAAKLSPGQSGKAVVALRNRLTAMGYLAPHLGGSFDARMTEAVRQFQIDHNLEADGVAGASTMSAINVSPEERLKSVMVAMERERWLNLPEGLGKRHVKVNLTDFHAQIIDDNKLTYETRSVIGHQDYDRRTPEFSDVMDHMVINPSWYVPRSIIVGEYLPLLRSNPGAVSHLQIIDGRGRVVGRGQSFAGYTARTFPFSMRQPPGPRNALGSVKFMFPNKYNIYLHDTPSQHLFAREVRTYSHGCIRLDDPHDFAYALLAKQESDPVNYFDRILNSRVETRVNLEQHVPVHLIYRTAFTQAKGHMNYRRDVYGRDAKIWNALVAAGVQLRNGRT
ncbi:L,D-transpeptidase family protein [Thalassococcus lentus]|uniref:L,D-transpeptidase family protein n=1 Tax=Thalassococcus lentus TaxID=1210524 RepID=A0ABT4XXH1_9RHOB|nr:L,D-transpeptidase family protein [Thalassococcus lentus]MDA7426582.1 L,D-transpeptidase family protein [Thalassococcus lentus]